MFEELMSICTPLSVIPAGLSPPWGSEACHPPPKPVQKTTEEESTDNKRAEGRANNRWVEPVKQ